MNTHEWSNKIAEVYKAEMKIYEQLISIKKEVGEGATLQKAKSRIKSFFGSEPNYMKLKYIAAEQKGRAHEMKLAVNDLTAESIRPDDPQSRQLAKEMRKFAQANFNLGKACYLFTSAKDRGSEASSEKMKQLKDDMHSYARDIFEINIRLSRTLDA